jgi:hypothetical protein
MSESTSRGTKTQDDQPCMREAPLKTGRPYCSIDAVCVVLETAAYNSELGHRVSYVRLSNKAVVRLRGEFATRFLCSRAPTRWFRAEASPLSRVWRVIRRPHTSLEERDCAKRDPTIVAEGKKILTIIEEG